MKRLQRRMQELAVLANANAPLAAKNPPRSQQDAALSTHETGLRKALVLAFGRGRFRLQDLWRERPGNRAWPALYEGFGAGRWPEPAWAERMRRELTRLPGIEPAPGPRGGEGWRVSPSLQSRSSANARTQRRNGRRGTRPSARRLQPCPAVSQRLPWMRRRSGSRPDTRTSSWRRARNGASCAWSMFDTVVEDWSRTHRYAGLSVVGGAIAGNWQHTGKLLRVLAQFDDVVAHHVEAAAKYYETRLAALAPYRTAAVGNADR